MVTVSLGWIVKRAIILKVLYLPLLVLVACIGMSYVTGRYAPWLGFGGCVTACIGAFFMLQRLIRLGARVEENMPRVTDATSPDGKLVRLKPAYLQESAARATDNYRTWVGFWTMVAGNVLFAGNVLWGVTGLF